VCSKGAIIKLEGTMKMHVIRKVILAFVVFVGLGATTTLAQAVSLHCTYQNGMVEDIEIASDGSTVSIESHTVPQPDGTKREGHFFVKNGERPAESPQCPRYVQITSSAYRFGFSCSDPSDMYWAHTIDRISGGITYESTGVAWHGTCMKTELHPKF